MFRFVGDGFLYNMVRILVGTILRGWQRAIEAQMKYLRFLDNRIDSRAGKTAPLMGCIYGKFFIEESAFELLT